MKGAGFKEDNVIHTFWMDVLAICKFISASLQYIRRPQKQYYGYQQLRVRSLADNGADLDSVIPIYPY